MILRTEKVICDRCGAEIDTWYGKKWEICHRKRDIKIFHEVPSWDRVDEYHLCDRCAGDFEKWMENEVDTDAN